MQITVKVLRFIPEKDSRPHYDTFTLDTQPTERVLDVLE